MSLRLGRARARCPGCPGSVSRARPPNRTCVSPRIRLSTCLARCSAAGGGRDPGSRDVRHAVAIAGHRDAGCAGEHDPVPNRRAESSLAQRCNLSCIRRTVDQAESSSGQATTPVFTSVSPSLCSLLLDRHAAVLPQVAGFPVLGVLRRLRPIRPCQSASNLSTDHAPGRRVRWSVRRMVPTFTVVRLTD